MNASFSGIPTRAAPSQRESRFVPGVLDHLTEKRIYSIYAISIFDDVLFYLVIDDLKTPVFLPASLFAVRDATLPSGWRLGPSLSEQVALVVGPAFISDSIESYSAMVDQAWDSVERLFRAIDSGDAPPPHP